MNPERTVALLHSYLADREGRKRPDRLGRTGVLAAAELYRHGKISKICITVEPELSELLSSRLNTLLNNPPRGDIVAVPETVTTAQEITFFRELAEVNSWDDPPGNLVTIGNQEHLPRINREIQKSYLPMRAMSTQEILSEYPRYKGILAEMDSWPEQKSQRTWERILGATEKMPLLANIMAKFGPRFYPKKIALQRLLFRLLEKKGL